jgi:hypothetical protein
VSVTPYSDLAETAFWRAAVAERHPYDLSALSAPLLFSARDRIATAGSCFAQHIGNQLRRRGARYVDLEPLPAGLPPEDAARFGYGLFSCRYGNVYTTRQLLQLLQEALGKRTPVERVWLRDGRFYDALRPSVDPVGHDSEDDVLLLRRVHLKRVKALLSSMDVFVFTLGLTEAWVSRTDFTVYPTAPGAIAGTWNSEKYKFVNFRYFDVMNDLKASLEILRSFNPKLRVILTVSPVPIKATASGDHVLVANTQSKSTLRAVAGDLAAEDRTVAYFPSYELIVSHSMRGMFFNPDLRTVNPGGVDYVMSKFFADVLKPQPANGAEKPATPRSPSENLPTTNFDLICDEEANDPG